MQNEDFWFCIDTSVKSVTIALYAGTPIQRSGKTPQHLGLVGLVSRTPDRISDGLLELIDFSFQNVSAKPSEFTNVLFCNGPGAFTSLRVGLATIQGLFAGVDVSVHTVSSLRYRCMVWPKDNVCTIGLGRGKVACGILEKGEYSEKVMEADEFESFVQGNPHLYYYGDPLKNLRGQVSFNGVAMDSPDPIVFSKIIRDQLYQKEPHFDLKLNYGAEPQIG